jgi:hypothetical protein
MSIKRTCCLITFFVSLNLMASAQLPDGVTATQSFLDTIKSNYNKENAVSFDVNSISTSANIPVNVHIVMNINGLAGVSVSGIKSGISTANVYFKNAGLQFYIDSVDYVKDYNYSYVTYNYLKKELLTKYAVSTGINLFLVDTIMLGSARSYGFTYFPNEADSNVIYLDKNYASGNSLTTMLGHYMGLLSTHETEGGKELADESNCSSSGDFICDTYADPDLLNQVIDTCTYIGTARDDAGKYYVPSVANLMSDSPESCKCILTPLQYRRIYYYYMKFRQYQNQ